MDPEVAYALVVVIASTGVFIASVELLTLNAEFEDGGLFSWDVFRTVSRTTLGVGRSKSTQLIPRWLFVPAVTGARAVAALILIAIGNSHPLASACVFAIVAASIVMYWRAPLGLDGADQMSLITFVALAVYKLFPADVHVAQASLWFIAFQGCLSYCAAGIAKVVSPVWRSGEAVRGILGTRTYGSRTSASLVRRYDGTCVALSWLLMLFECSFPLALAFGETGFVVFAVLGVLFHISNAVIMGLNTFVWAFVATYPAILYCAISLRP
jgi:hypothetical protein